MISQMRISFVLVLAAVMSSSIAQVTFRIAEDIDYADFKVLVSDDISHPDLRVLINDRIKDPDFTIGITDDIGKANLIITTADYAEVIVRASDHEHFPHIRVMAGDSIQFPDIKIGIREEGEVHYLIYTEKASLPVYDLITILLPAIHDFIGRPNARLNALFGD